MVKTKNGSVNAEFLNVVSLGENSRAHLHGVCTKLHEDISIVDALICNSNSNSQGAKTQ